MKNKNIKVIDEHNIDRNANVMFAVELNGSEYVVYWIERDEESNNVFVSKVLKNLDETHNMLNIDDADKKKEVSEIVKFLISSAVSDLSDKLDGITKTLANGETARFISVSFNKEQNINVPKTYITTVKKEVTRVVESYYDVVTEEAKIDNVLTAAPVMPAEPEIVEPITNVVLPTPEVTIPTPVVETPVVQSMPEATIVASPATAPVMPEPQTVVVTPEVPVQAPVAQPTPVAVTPEPVLVQPAPAVQSMPEATIVVSPATAPVMPEPQTVVVTPEVPVQAPVAQPTPVAVTPEPVLIQPAPAVQSMPEATIVASPATTPVIPESQTVVVTPEVPVQAPVAQPTPVAVTPEPVLIQPAPVVPESIVSAPAATQQTLVFNASKETNLNAALGEVANSNVIPVENINVVREFGEEAPVAQAPVQPGIAPMVQSQSAVDPKILVKKAGFANSKFFMVIAIGFFMASCVFLGYEVFNYFQLIK